MHDPDFQTPIQKEYASPEQGFALPPNSSLAVVSLVFGIIGWIVLPLIGALIAIITGHLAVSEIEEAGGRLGGRALAKAGLMLGYSWFVVAVLAVVIVFGLLMGTTRFVSVPPPTKMMTPVPAASGVKMSNELSERDIAEISMLHLAEDDDKNEVICLYRDTPSPEGEASMAVLTTKQIASLKGNRVTAFALKDVESILDNDACRVKYHPNAFSVDVTFYTIELKSRTGQVMRIAIRPPLDGPAFFHALQDAWKNATERATTTVKP